MNHANIARACRTHVLPREPEKPGTHACSKIYATGVRVLAICFVLDAFPAASPCKILAGACEFEAQGLIF